MLDNTRLIMAQHQMYISSRHLKGWALGSMDEAVLGQRIRQLREHQGLSSRALARAAGLSETYVSQIERGRETPSLKTLAKIARALGVPLGDLVDEGGKAKEPVELKELLTSEETPVLYQGKALPVDTKRKVVQMLDAALSLREEPKLEAVGAWHEGRQPIPREAILELAKELAKEFERMQEEREKKKR